MRKGLQLAALAAAAIVAFAQSPEATITGTMASLCNLIGTMSGTAVAATIGTGIVRPDVINVQTVGAAMVGIVVWSVLAWYFGLPTSESHALVADLTGAGLPTAGAKAIVWSGWQKVLIGVLFSTLLGFFGALLLMAAIYRLFQRKTHSRVRQLFGRLQILSAAFMAFSHGSNDGQKFIGAFTLVLMLGGLLPEFAVPLWVILLCGVTMAVGTAVGGWRIARTMGVRLTKLEPVHGFAAETAAATTIEIATRLGIPFSTTHTISTAIMGVGATRRLSAVRWGVTFHIVAAWVLTFSVCGAIAWAVMKLAQSIDAP